MRCRTFRALFTRLYLIASNRELWMSKEEACAQQWAINTVKLKKNTKITVPIIRSLIVSILKLITLKAACPYPCTRGPEQRH